MGIMTRAKFHFNQLTLTLIFGIRASANDLKAGPDRVKQDLMTTKRSLVAFEI